jgi:hypothetical protein
MGADANKLTSEEHVGIIPRSVKHILNSFSNSQMKEIKVCFQEIYLDSIRDLLDPSNFVTQTN